MAPEQIEFTGSGDAAVARFGASIAHAGDTALVSGPGGGANVYLLKSTNFYGCVYSPYPRSTSHMVAVMLSSVAALAVRRRRKAHA